jgi:predicted PurR-regulated permease PerM
MFFVFYPFMGVLALAIILSIALQPVYEKIKHVFKYEGLSSLIVILLLAVFIIIPLLFLGWQIFQEAQSLYAHISGEKLAYLEKIANLIEKPIRNYIPNFSIDLNVYIEKIFSWLTNNIGALVSGTTQTLTSILLIIFSLFFLLKDNKKLKKLLIELSPLDDKYDSIIIEKTETTVNSVVRGSLLVAIIYGLIMGISFWFFGVPSPTLWGTVTVIASLIPPIGAALVILPVIVYLGIVGNYFAAFGLFVWGTLIMVSIEQYLRPTLFKRGISAHPLFILFSVLGGLSFFGPSGLIFGPIILSLFLTLLDIYKIFSKPKQD